jgi:hypothetical protein
MSRHEQGPLHSAIYAALCFVSVTDCAAQSGKALVPEPATGSSQSKYSVQVPNGLAFSDFRGYENWQVVAVSQTDDLLKAMVANPTMIDAYRAGVPLDGDRFPDGSKIAKIEWKPKKSTEAPFQVRIPDTLQDVFLIEKDSKKFPKTEGWAYAAFDYDPASDTFTPDKAGVIDCGFACHSGVAKKDYIFTAYGRR